MSLVQETRKVSGALWATTRFRLIGCRTGIGVVTSPQHAWSSRDLAYALWRGHDVDHKQFRDGGKNSKYRPTQSKQRLAKTEAPRTDDDDVMDIDDDVPAARDIFEDYIPSHALDDLHRQVISHFTIAFKELADRVRRESGDTGPPVQSQYAPEYRRKAFQLWSVGDCLEYLQSKKRLQVSDPPLSIFMLRRSEGRGWRRGQDWPRQSWENILRALEDIGQQFEDSLVLQSLAELRPHVTEIFNTRMRPTGI